MKKMLAVVVLVLLAAGPALAAWSYTPSTPVVQFAGAHNAFVELVFTGDGSASGALNINTILSAAEMKRIADAFLMSVSVTPGTTTVAPDAAYDINVYDRSGTQTIDQTTTSASSKHTYEPTYTSGVPAAQQVLGSIPFDIGDIGTSGDQVTITFNFYIP